MDQAGLSSDSVLQTLLKTNRPPTDEETAIIRESMAPTNATLKSVEAQISETMARIEALKLQVKQAENKLQRLREEEAAIWETFADHRRIFSPFRNIPEDVLREICIQACMGGDIPALSYSKDTLPYVLAQICSGMRHIALTTPIIWASMHVEIGAFFCLGLRGYERVYSALARKASTWFDRAGGLGLTVSIVEYRDSYPKFDVQCDPSTILFDTLLSYSTRWKELKFDSHCDGVLSAPMARIAALTAVDVPLLQSVSFVLEYFRQDPELYDSVLLKIPTLKHVKLETWNIQVFTVDWAILTSITLRGYSYWPSSLSRGQLATILQQTKCLVFCDIDVGPGDLQEHSPKISLPFLKTLIVGETASRSGTSGAQSILDLITAPILEILHMGRLAFLNFSDFFKRSPCIWKLSIPYFDNDKSLTDVMGFLSHCPSLTVLSIWPCNWNLDTRDANIFLQAFVEGDTSAICPRLQYFEFTGNIDFSLQTLSLFLEGKQGDLAALNIMPWKKVAIDVRGIKDAEKYQQVLDLFSQKKAAGLDIQVKRPRDGCFY
ncbi:hypothetical protein HYPSUDRAFT_44691 [Hypholoma sublateritium FD-334 SS-4]|uniref:F-box domain-containing protein n=1 Tax=Hypholoma sublateritium (strain FD-334 SS-4) TaxID=945553 RepID=A0A0D2NQG5_HYPSF|nr:hypothetical protein HYPSUDRAFT_44691 [Hypholoma sublateritium FD-334 SS-4]